MAKDNLGDGTGCDNMTAVIVQFKPKLFEENEQTGNGNTEEAITTTKASSKRAASGETISGEGKKLKLSHEDIEASVSPSEPTSTWKIISKTKKQKNSIKI